MRAASVVAMAACLTVGLCGANNPAPQCALDCASSIRDDKGSLDLKTICGDKLMTNSLFQCLISSCSHDIYGPAVAHVVLACSDLGMSIGPLHPVVVQHVDLEKPRYLPTPSVPAAAYSTPADPDPSLQDAGRLKLGFDISIDLKCNSGSDGLVTVSLPPSIPPAPSASPPSQAPDPENGGGEGENGTDDGESTASSSSPTDQTQAAADPSVTSSCPPESATSSTQDASGEQTPSPSTDAGDQGGHAVTSAPSPTSPGGGYPESPASASPCSTTSEDTGGPDPQDPNQSGSSLGSPTEPSHPPNGNVSRSHPRLPFVPNHGAYNCGSTISFAFSLFPFVGHQIDGTRASVDHPPDGKSTGKPTGKSTGKPTGEPTGEPTDKTTAPSENEPVGSVMVKIIRPGEASAETTHVALWGKAPSATAASEDTISNEDGHASPARFAIGSILMAESAVDADHDAAAASNSSPTQTRFVTSRPKATTFSVQAVDAATLLPKVELTSGDSKPKPRLCTIVLLMMLISGILMS
ncbi:hypothetical protein Trco_003596 [Trichoderma cornu-damae]|uniref:Extracellular membrane protein CFEM domain-containing protein n=1 Tax=Trichoderma cornu-damae TaxID=654480 RepID=A0A9P8TWB1_9HYPO|nr:hypothetical protein Trco_003596 [Trichoderma cornu-damae]